LLCSDGLTTMVRPGEIEEILDEEPDAERAAQRLVDAANAAGGEDNITAVVIEVVEVDEDDDDNPTSSLATAPVVGEVVEDDEADDDATGTAPRRQRKRRGWGRRIARTLLWVLPVLAVLALAFAAVAWYARGTYFVGVNQSRVTIFKGRPGGVLGWDPTVDKETGIDTSQLSENELDDVKAKKTFSSRGGADDYVRRLRTAIEQRTPATTVPPPPESTVPPITAAPAAVRT
jgi:PPM family protein phosphatase